MEKAKKIKVNMNPKKVQNPAELHKRSPGKFDQKVYMEQENYSSHAIQEMTRIHAMQVHSTALKYDKDTIALKKKRKQYDSRNTSYTYIKQLRQAFNDENDRRETLARKLEEFARKQAEPSPEPIVDVVVVPQKNYKPWENMQEVKLPELREKTMMSEIGSCRKQIKTSYLQTGLRTVTTGLDPVGKAEPSDESISLSARRKLEKLSAEIITATLPVGRLRRIFPPEQKSSGEAYPIMSYYRRSTILPEVKKIKRRMTTDTSELHSKINQYFGTHLPLSSYTFPKSSKPHKQRLLKAISNDAFRLPQIPPELR